MKLNGKTATRTLAFVNRVRAGHGQAPLEALPKGKQDSTWQCPVARGVACTGQEVYADGGLIEVLVPTDTGLRWLTYETPGYVRDFMEAFDNERIPELIEGAPRGS